MMDSSIPVENKNIATAPKQARAFTIVDVMITIMVITIAMIGTMSAFPYIMRAILVSKARSLANIIAQEQLEVYKNTPYYKLYVTTPTVTDSRFGDDVRYDTRYYAPETVITGGIEYEKLTYVEKVAEINSEFIHVDWADPDVGMKRIYVHVLFRSDGGGGDWKKVTLSALMENTDRQQLNASITGVTKTTEAAAIPNVSVYIQENPAFQTTSDATGRYTFNVPVGSWTLVASATGYFVHITTPVVTSSGIATPRDIYLTRRFLATVTGYVYIQDHLVITQVVASTNASTDDGWEWVELYNPTTYPILIASRQSPTSAWDVFNITVAYICKNNHEPPDMGMTHPGRNLVGLNSNLAFSFRSTSTHWTAETTTVAIPSQSFFLIANVSTITALYGISGWDRVADAYYYNTTGYDPAVPYNIIQAGVDGGIRVTGQGGYGYNGRTDWHDGLAWGGDDITYAMETSGNSNTLGNSDIFYRFSYKYTVSDCDDTEASTMRGTPPFLANAFDSDNNGANCGTGSDFDYNADSSFHITSSSALANADFSMPPYTGTPAKGAIVSANDGLSSVAFVQRYGSFTLTDVTTGAWTITIVSATPQKNYYTEIYSTVSLTTPRLGVPGPLSTPAWSYSKEFSTLTFTTSKGIIAGRVTNVLGRGIKGITIDAFTEVEQTDSQGYYRIHITSGVYTVNCNVTNSNGQYIKQTSAAVSVELGQTHDGVDFILVSGGNLEGFITTNGVDPLPNYSVSLQKDGAEYATGLSGTDGKFLLTNVATVSATAPYTLYCITDPGESVDPSDGIVSTPIAGNTVHVGTFTITAGLATFTGDVTLDNNKIETGVIIVASTQPIISVSSGPTINSSIVGGTTAYYFAASGADGRYTLKVLGGDPYYIYGWYTTDREAVIRKSSAPTAPIEIGETKTIHLRW